MNVFSLFAKIGLDTKGYEQGLKESKGKFNSFADGLKGAAGKLGDVLAGIGKAAAAGVGAASTALTALTKKSLDAVADYEQLVGGVDKIFGESSKKVQEYANQAYSEAGLSANEYMNAVTSFSASLLQSLGNDTDAAADAANRAIIDMADNVNTYGSSMESVQNAYQGFAKTNYTMLDNLKLGYGGTKEEMARLIQDAAQMNEEMAELGVTVDADSMSFGNIVNAISVVQKHMKIAGTTHNEAAKTISGSIASMKAAWQNFLTGTGSPAQFTTVLSDAVKNIRTKLDTIIPRLTEGLTVIVDQVAPEIPGIIEQTLPSIITGASSLLTGLAGRLPQLIPAIVPAVAQGIINVSTEIVNIFPQLLTSLKDAGKEVIKKLFPNGADDIRDITERAGGMITTFAAKITDPQNTKKLIDKGFEVVRAFLDGLTSQKALDEFLSPDHGAPKIIENLGESLVTFVSNLADTASTIITNIADYLCDPENEPEINRAATMILMSLGEGFVKVVRVLYDSVVRTTSKIMEYYIESFDGDTVAEKMIKALGHGLVNAVHFLTNPIGFVNDKIKDMLGLESREELEDRLAYNESTFSGYKDEWDAMTPEQKALYSKGTSMIDDSAILIAQGMRSSGHIPSNMGEEYLMRYSGKHATGFYARRPAFLSGDWVGENGEEVLLPLDRNDEWADKLAAKIGGGGTHIDNINVSVQFADSADDATIKRVVNNMVNEISEQLAELQGRESRGLGLGYRGGEWL